MIEDKIGYLITTWNAKDPQVGEMNFTKVWSSTKEGNVVYKKGVTEKQGFNRKREPFSPSTIN